MQTKTSTIIIIVGFLMIVTGLAQPSLFPLSTLSSCTLTITPNITSPAAGQIVTFTEQASGCTWSNLPLTFSISATDGWSPTNQQVQTTSATFSHAFSASGTYTVTGTVSNSAGNQNAATMITASVAMTTTTQTTTTSTTSGPSITGMTVTPTSGVAPLTVYFSATVTGGQTPYTWAWTMGDGSTNTTANGGQHTYSSPCTSCILSLTVTDALGRTATFSYPTPLSITAATTTTTQTVTVTSGISTTTTTVTTSTSCSSVAAKALVVITVQTTTTQASTTTTSTTTTTTTVGTCSGSGGGSFQISALTPLGALFIGIGIVVRRRKG